MKFLACCSAFFRLSSRGQSTVQCLPPLQGRQFILFANMNRGLAENFVNSELLPNCKKKSTNNARIEYKYLAILVVFPLGQFWLDEVGKVRKFSENSSSWVQPVTRKTSDYLAYMTGNSRQVILHREMVSLVLVNAAANRIARRCVLNTMAVIYQTLVSWLSLPRGLLKFRKWLMT